MQSNQRVTALSTGKVSQNLRLKVDDVDSVEGATGHTTGSIFWRLKQTCREQSISRQVDLVLLVLSIAEFG